MLFRTFAGVVLAFCCKNRQRIETEVIAKKIEPPLWHGTFKATIKRKPFPKQNAVRGCCSLMAANGTKQTSSSTLNMSAFGGKADISDRLADVRK